MKTLKRTISILCMVVMTSSVLNVGAFAFDSDEISNNIVVDGYEYDSNGNIIESEIDEDIKIAPLMDPFETYYRVKNKTLKKTQKDLDSYITGAWAKASQYTVEKGKSYTSSLSVSLDSKFKSGIIASGSFTSSKTVSYKVTTYIPANASKYSKLAKYTEYKVYSADLYSYQSNGVQQMNEKFINSGTVYEPNDVYLQVVYQ